MALVITNFGGEVPRVPPRALAAGAAQRYENLLATATELRPLGGDKTIGTATAGDQTLYRLSRNADGTLRTGDTEGWFTEAADKSYIKGQLNDDATERTVAVWNDGTSAPRVIDAKGENRLLGVPPPTGLAVTLNASEEFTMDEALTWVSAELVPSLAEKLLAALSEARVVGSTPVAGAYSLFGHSVSPSEPWLVEWPVTLANAQNQGLTGPEIGGRSDGANWMVPLELLPYWGYVTDQAALQNALRLVENPSTGSQAFTDDQLITLAKGLSALFDPDGNSIKAKRTKLEQLGKAFDALMTFSAAAQAPRPVEPTKPSVPEWTWETEYSASERRPEWVAYDAAYAQWQSDLAAWEKTNGQVTDDATSRTAKAREIQAQAVTVSNEIEAEYFRRKDDINALVTAYINGESLLGDGGMIAVDPDRIVESRFYIATYVTDWGEESAPCKVSDLLEVDQNDSVTVAIPAPPADRHITHWRLYRSNAGTQTATFQFVDEMLIGTPTYLDELLAEQLGEPCPTLTWAEPPKRLDSASPATIKPVKGVDPYLRGVVGMPNGIIAGFIDNYVAFCHPYHVYAWPVEYQITTEHPIVGLGVFGQTLFVGTMGSPYLISGADSASMSAIKLDSEHSCVSRKSIASVGNGVIYASPDGLCMASANGVQLLTSDLFAREDWQALQPDKIMAAIHEGVYYFWTPVGCWALDFIGKKLGHVEIDATAVHRDILTDRLYVVSGDQILQLFGEGRRTAVWRSGIAQLPNQKPLAWLQIDGDQSPAVPVVARWYGDGQLRYTATVTGITPMRVPPGRWLEHELEIETAARVTKAMMAGDTQELKSA